MSLIRMSFCFVLLQLSLSANSFASENGIEIDNTEPMVADIKMSAKMLKVSHLAYVEMTKFLKTDSFIEDVKYKKIDNYDVAIFIKKNSYEFSFSRHGWNGFGGGVIFTFNNKTLLLEDTIRTK